MVGFFLNIVEITIGVTVLSLILLLAMRLWGGKFTAKCRYILWMLVVIRLAIPVSLNLLPAVIEVPLQPVITEQGITEDNVPLSDNMENNPTVNNPGVNQSGEEIVNPPVGEQIGSLVTPNPTVPQEPWIPATPVSPTVPTTPTTPTLPEGNVSEIPANPTIPAVKDPQQAVTFPDPIPETPKEPVSVERILEIVSVVYITGVVLFLAWNLTAYFQYTKRILRTAKPADEKTAAIFRSICAKEKLRRQPELLVSSQIDSPAAFGMIRHRIVLPDIAFSENGLVSTLSHEVVHCRRGDLFVKAAELLARAFHWFNPIAHISAFRCEMEMEMSCDETVLSGCSDEIRAAYGSVMLDIIRRCRQQNRGVLTTHFNPKKNLVKMRISNIINGSGSRRGRVLIPICLALCILAGAVVSCTIAVDKKGEETKEPDETTEITETEIQELYNDFLSEKANAVDKDGNVITLGDCVRNDPNAAYKKYAIYDMNGDDLPELIVKTSCGLNIFSIIDGQVTLWYHGTNYEKPLDNGTILYERPGGAPPHTSYAQIELGSEGEEISRVSFEEYQGGEDDTTYFVNSVQVTEEEYKKVAEPILALSDGKITWSELPYGTPHEDKEPVVEQEYVKVHSNPGEMNIHTVVLPGHISNHNAKARFFRYDDRYVLCVTCNIEGSGSNQIFSDVCLYVVDVSAGAIIHSQRLDDGSVPDTLTYTENKGVVIWNIARDEMGSPLSMAERAYEISIANGMVNVTKRDYDAYPRYEKMVTSPDGSLTAYFMVDDTHYHGGVELHYPDGTVKRIKENYVVLPGEGIESNVYGCLSSYFPVGFLDDKHLVIGIGAHESPSSYEIYNVETGETVKGLEREYRDDCYIQFSPVEVIDGWMYLNEWRSDYSYNNRCGAWKIDLAGNMVKLAHKYDTDGVISIPEEAYWGLNGGVWQMYDSRYNAWSMELLEYFESQNYRLKKTIYSADYQLLAEIEYPFFHGNPLNDVYVYGNDCTVITFTEGGASNDGPYHVPLVKVHSNPGGLDFKTIVLPNNRSKDFYPFNFNETYYLIATYGVNRDDMNRTQSLSDYTLYLINTENGTLADYHSIGELRYTPYNRHYTSDGLVLFDMDLDEESQTYSSPGALKITVENGRLAVSETAVEPFPYHVTKLTSPDGRYTVYQTVDDGNTRGGIDVVYQNGGEKRIFTNLILEDLPADGSLGKVTGYNPIQFIDEHRLLYRIGGWEWTQGYGIYDLDTDEKTEFRNGYSPMCYEDGTIYLSQSVSYETVAWYKADLDGNITKIASIDEEDGVFHVTNASEFRLHRKNERSFFSVNSAAGMLGEDVLNLKILSPSFENVLAEVTYDCTDAAIYVISHGNTETAVVFANGVTMPERDDSELTHPESWYTFVHDGVKYDLSKIYAGVNGVGEWGRIGKYVIAEGHINPNTCLYAVINPETKEIEHYFSGIAPTYHSNDINTMVYAYWSVLRNYNGENIAELALDDGEYISNLTYTNDNRSIVVTIEGGISSTRHVTVELTAAETGPTEYAVSFPLEDERDYITVAALYGKDLSSYYPDGRSNIIRAGNDGTLYYVMGVGNSWWSSGNFKSFRTYRVTSKNGVIASVEETETFTKAAVLQNGTPYTGELDGLFHCLAYKFDQGNFDYNLRSHSVYITSDGKISASTTRVGTGPATIYEGTYQYDVSTGSFTADIPGRYVNEGDVSLYPDTVVKGKLYEYGGFVHFICEESTAHSILPTDPLPLTFIPNTDGYADPPHLELGTTVNGNWRHNGEDATYGLFIDNDTASIRFIDVRNGRLYEGSYTINPVTYTKTAVLRPITETETSADRTYTMKFTVGWSSTVGDTTLFLDVFSFDAPEYSHLEGKALIFKKAGPNVIQGSELPANSEEAYAAVLDSKMKLSGRLSGEYLGHYLEKNELSIRKTAVLDLDGDGGGEMVLWLGHHTNDYYGFLILHHENDMVYAYDESYRAFNDLNADGTFCFSSGVSNGGIGRLQFANGLCTTIRLAYCESADNTNVFYYIDDQSVTKDEYIAFTAKQKAKEDAPWVDYPSNE